MRDFYQCTLIHSEEKTTETFKNPGETSTNTSKSAFINKRKKNPVDQEKLQTPLTKIFNEQMTWK